MSTDSSLSLLDKLKNKGRYYVEKLVNDPDANTFARERNKGSPAPVPVTVPIKEAMEDAPVEEPESSSPVIRVLQKMLYYTKLVIKIAFFPFLSALLASLIANEMIIYPSPIRLIFFIFTLSVCLLAKPIIVLLSVFYLCKWGFHYYINKMSDGPKRIIMPTLFAFLPLTTKEYSNSLVNILARPFQYGEKWSVADGKELEQRMELYQQALKESFPYVESIQATEPFQSQLQKIETSFHELHQAFNPNQQEANQQEAPKETPPLPATV